jgi:hypothetical protein
MSGWISFIVGGLIGGYFGKAWYSPSPRQEAKAILARKAREENRAARVRAEMDRLRHE